MMAQGPSRGRTSVSFSAPDEDQMLIAATESGLLSSEDEDEAMLPLSLGGLLTLNKIQS